MAQRLKGLPAMLETQIQSLGRDDPLEKEMVTHFSILAWRIPWMDRDVIEKRMEILILLFLILFTFHLIYAICVYVLLLSSLDCTHFEVNAHVFDISV